MRFTKNHLFPYLVGAERPIIQYFNENERNVWNLAKISQIMKIAKSSNDDLGEFNRIQ